MLPLEHLKLVLCTKLVDLSICVKICVATVVTTMVELDQKNAAGCLPYSCWSCIWTGASCGLALCFQSVVIRMMGVLLQSVPPPSVPSSRHRGELLCAPQLLDLVHAEWHHPLRAA